VSIPGVNDASVFEPVLTANEAADLLHVSIKTVLRLARGGELPGRKIGREWRFERSALLMYVAGPARPLKSIL
jgi:excisionase family DNA binding protein